MEPLRYRMKLLFKLILFLWLELASSTTLPEVQQALEIDVQIRAELESIRGFANGNQQFMAWHKFLMDSLHLGSTQNQDKLANLHAFQKYNKERLALETTLLSYCNSLQGKIRGYCYKYYRILRDECVMYLQKKNSSKAAMIKKIKESCSHIQSGKEADYGYGSRRN
ncbi:uncharacterized protein LOC111064660 isoform X2 [Drosophila obscura]|uniref:uncharacterized protein LOC111064660 isoform X2 n=1 Tax=Drosophila obscura TaxID=7282 RepID=UPI001BB1D113|nr:uncharacterized protein LOC111064660 isoform X2 [Drosophila obscura]